MAGGRGGRGARRGSCARVVGSALAVATLALLACGPSEAPASVATAPPGPPTFFSREGLPGPWWREGGAREPFDRDASHCVKQSRAARRGAKDPADAAYRAFLDCMEARRWGRGVPPRPPA